MEGVCISEGVRTSEGPLWEVPLYIYRNCDFLVVMLNVGLTQARPNENVIILKCLTLLPRLNISLDVPPILVSLTVKVDKTFSKPSSCPCLFTKRLCTSS